MNLLYTYIDRKCSMKQLLIGITNDNKKVIIYEANTLFELDCFT